MARKSPKNTTSSIKTSSRAQKKDSAAKKEPEKVAMRGSKAATSDKRTKASPKRRAKLTASISPVRLKPIVEISRLFEIIENPIFARFRVSFARPDDLLVCDFIFDNMKLDGTKLVRIDRNRQSTLIVELPPQSFSEEAFLDATGPEVAADPSGDNKFEETSKAAKPKNDFVGKAEELADGNLPFAKIRMSGPSRIAFAMPAAVTELPFTVDAILDACRRWPMRLDTNAVREPESNLFLEIPKRDALLFNKSWLNNVTSTGEWSKATRTLLATLGQGSDFERLLVAAAKRMANRARVAFGTRVRKGIGNELTRAMNAEIDKLGRKFSSVREGVNRDIALATLSLVTTKEVALSPKGDFTASVFRDLPFLRVMFSPHKPSPTTTALELPYRLITSPIPDSNWWHETKPVARNGRTELWHTRLTNTLDGIGADPGTKIRALWSPDYDLDEGEIIGIVNARPTLPFRSSLDALDRQMLVTLMADFNTNDVDGNTFIPRAARSQRLALSALGALLDVEGNWNFLPTGVGLEQWRHLATLGRDHYVRVVYRGFLCPFGHSASLIKVTERKFEYLDKTKKKNRVAVLRQRFFIIVREPVKQFTGTGHEYGGRNFPFTSVELLTRVTPNLLAPENATLGDSGKTTDKIYGSAAGKLPHRACFWSMLGTDREFKFQVAATDLSGDNVTFAMPLLFVGIEANPKDSVVAEIISRYDAPATVARRTVLMSGASVCYAPVEDGAEGDPRLPTRDMTFAAAKVKGVPKSKPQFYPETESAECGVAAMQRLLQQPHAMIRVAYPLIYKKEGFSLTKNPGEVFLQTLAPFELAFGDQVKSDNLGGLATPSMSIQGLSRIMGPVAAKPPAGTKPEDIEASLTNVVNNSFNPVDFFKGAKILGGIDLSSLVSGAASLAGEDVPKLLSRQLANKIEASFSWRTTITKSDPAGIFVHSANNLPTVLEMRGVMSSPISDPKATTFSAVASISNFRINLFGCIILWFDNLSFTSKSGSKPDVAVDLHPGGDAVVFTGPLEFVDTLRSIIPSNGFSDPPSLSVTPSGIKASYSLNIPSVAVGIFALEHVSLGAGFTLPFDAKPAEVRFNFCERQRPFSLTVSLLGGGGFFAIGIGTDGIREVEAALEFGAALSIDLGVASGSVEIKAGVYFHWLKTSVELAGYVRLHGELSVLGLISASLTFNLQLAYLKDKAKHRTVVWGEASIEVEIEILFLSFSVSVSCRREFGGADSDPKFIALIPDQSTWAEYCEAFAEEAA